jgi:hypothetical protein
MSFSLAAALALPVWVLLFTFSAPHALARAKGGGEATR